MSEKNRIFRKLYKLLSRRVLSSPARAGHYLPSIISTPADSSRPSERLLELAFEAIRIASQQTITGANEALPDSHLYNRFPGEHYRLLKAIVQLLNPALIVEIGTFTGMGSFALRQSAQGALHTFDILAWDTFQSHLKPGDFAEDTLVQHLADLSDPAQFAAHKHLLESASLIFLDGPKDGVFEEKMLGLLSQLGARPGRLLVIDDIRFVNMVDNWNAIDSPKLDLSSFGHWSGTGLVDLSEPLRLA